MGIKDKGKIPTNLYIDKTKGIVYENDHITISFTIQEEVERLDLRKERFKGKGR